MKRHLFYTFLSIFIATASVTLLGITKAVSIDDKYLTPLFGALLIELVGTVIGMYRGVNFFDDEKTSQSKDTDLPKLGIEKPIVVFDDLKKQLTTEGQIVKLENTLKKQLASPNQDDLLNLEDYFVKLDSLVDRHKEKSNLRKETHGSTVVFSGTVMDIWDLDRGPRITCKSESGNTVFIYLPSDKEADAYSLRKDDFIKVCGIVDTGMQSSTSISAENFERIKYDNPN